MNSYEILNRRTPQHLPESHTRRTEEPILLTEEELQMYDLNFADPVGNAGYEAWNRERHLTPVDGSFLMSDSCIVSIRGVQPYVDECYNLLEDERYKLANSYY